MESLSHVTPVMIERGWAAGGGGGGEEEEEEEEEEEYLPHSQNFIVSV